MVGLSGGGWYTTFLSSLIPEINSSYSIAGTAPLIFYAIFDNHGDWEQHETSIFKEITYVDLYILSTLDENFNSNRKHYQIYNHNDPCCFGSDTSKYIDRIFKDLNIPNFEVLIWKNNKHSILIDEFMELLNSS